MNGEPRRIGVAGAGRWGMNIVRCCARMGVLAAVCDPDLHSLDAVRSRYPGVRIFCDYASMLGAAGLDGVVVAAPAQLHAQLALAALEAGMDLFVEKPLALNVGDARSIVDAARSAGKQLMVGHVLLYHPAIRRMLRAVENGEIGDVRHLRSRRLSWGRLRSHEDVWWSFAPHDVAVMLEVFAEEPRGVTSASSAYVRPHLADVAYADFQFSFGRSAHIEVAWIDPGKTSRIDVFGTSGVLSFSDGPDGGRLTLTRCGDRIGARGEPELWQEKPQTIDVPFGEPLALELESFCESIGDGPIPPTGGEEGLAVVRTLALIERRAVAAA